MLPAFTVVTSRIRQTTPNRQHWNSRSGRLKRHCIKTAWQWIRIFFWPRGDFRTGIVLVCWMFLVSLRVLEKHKVRPAQPYYANILIYYNKQTVWQIRHALVDWMADCSVPPSLLHTHCVIVAHLWCMLHLDTQVDICRYASRLIGPTTELTSNLRQ